jgi:hypothetical protein
VPLGTTGVTLWGTSGPEAAKSPLSPKKKDKSPAKPRKKPHRGPKWGLAPLNFRLNFSPALRSVGAVKNAAAKRLSPELGNEVSGLVEKLSRKIHIQTTKSYGFGVVSVYL